MAYVSVAEWRPEQVTEWLKGLDNSVVPYLHWFSNNEINGQQLLNLTCDELTHLGVHKLGHQELILEAVQHLRNFHYELDRENLQLLALRLSCAAHSLYSEIRDKAETSSVPTQIMADVAHVVNMVKPLVSWLDRPPFSGLVEYAEYKTLLLSLSLEMATCAQRDRFAEKPMTEIRISSSKLTKLADNMIQDISDPMLLQPATLDLATIKKRVGEDLGFFLVPSFHGVHQIAEMKLSSPAQQSGKIQQGDEIVQVNYQTVVGWARKKVLALFEESPNDLLLTLKRRPRHFKMYGQIYMKPYRLPSRKRSSPYSRWNDNMPSPRPELLTIPHFQMPRPVVVEKKVEAFSNGSLLEQSATSSSSDEDFGQPLESRSPTSMRLYLPKPRAPIQRRFTLSGPPRPSAHSEQFWLELQLERSWRSNQNNSELTGVESQHKTKLEDMFHLRDKSASFCNAISNTPRPATCMPFSHTRPLTNASDANSSRKAEENGGENEACGTTVLNSCVKLSIVELNKLKREAFFNNMDCSSAAVTSRFKQNKKPEEMQGDGEEEVKSPGKVLQLIDDFERRRVELKAEERGTVVRGRLDKSCSTPAYDLSDTETEEKEMRNLCDDEMLQQRWRKERQSERENHGQMVNTINDYLLPDGDLYGKIHRDRTSSEGHKKKTAEILETVNLNLALVELKQQANPDTHSDNYFFNVLPPQDVKKPIPAQRKLKSQEALASPGPLPPKPRPRPLPPSPEVVKSPRSSSPPEPPPRPESTFLRSPTRTSPQRPGPPDETSPQRPEPLDEISPLPSPASVPTTPLDAPPEAVDRDALQLVSVPAPAPIPVLNVITERERPKASSGGTLESLKAMLTLGRKPLSFTSPRSVRKKNALLARRRHVSVKDVSPSETAGYLAHRNRKGAATASWTRCYFLLQGSNFYGFKSKESHKADLFVHLPGFTCSVATEVKSRPFAFKIYHTGTVFYFSADSEEDLHQWLDSVTLATVGQEDRPPDSVTFSETDSDSSDTEPELETCFPTSPKMKKFLGSSPTPKPARSHQNLATESNKPYDIQKKFGSLKKFSSQKHHSSTPGGANSDCGGSVQSPDVASLDRKYLRFLGQKNSPVPVPTSQFRSYRRMQPPPPPTTPPHNQGKPSVKVDNRDINELVGRNSREVPRLTRRTLHSSNPSLIHAEMADYRVTQERLAEFRRIRNQDRPLDLSGFMTLEQFMLARQEEERVMRSNHQRPRQGRAMPEVITIDQFVSSHDERPVSRSSRTRVFPACSPVATSRPPLRPPSDIALPPPRKHSTTEPPQVTPRSTKPRLKNATQYQPPPSSSQSDEGMTFAFEMTLDQSRAADGCGEANGCSHVVKEATPDYPGLEYPPAFEPETYTLQYMLKSRRRRDADKNK